MTQVKATNQLGWGIQALGPGYDKWTFSFTEQHEDGSESPLVFDTKEDAEKVLHEPKTSLDPQYEFRVYPVLESDTK